MRPIYRDKAHRQLIDILTDKNPETLVAVFPTIKALQCYAAMLGFEFKRRSAFDNKSDNIDWHTFDNDGYTQYIFLIALAETGDISVLKEKSENVSETEMSDNMIQIFEEYAHGGFNILQRWLNDEPSDPYGASAIIRGLMREGLLSQKHIESSFSDPEF